MAGKPERGGRVQRTLSNIKKYRNSNLDSSQFQSGNAQRRGRGIKIMSQDEINSLYHSSEVILDSCSGTIGQISCWHILL